MDPGATLTARPTMDLTGWILLLLIGGFVWGGFVLLVLTALRKERGKRDAD